MLFQFDIDKSTSTDFLVQIIEPQENHLFWIIVSGSKDLSVMKISANNY